MRHPRHRRPAAPPEGARLAHPAAAADGGGAAARGTPGEQAGRDRDVRGARGRPARRGRRRRRRHRARPRGGPAAAPRPGARTRHRPAPHRARHRRPAGHQAGRLVRTRTRTRTRRRLAGVTAVAAVAVLASGCAAAGGGERETPATPLWSSASASPSATASAEPDGPVAPLTGLAVDADVAERPAVAVAVADRAGHAAPRGLSAADLVYEEYDGTRSRHLVAVFQSKDARRVGPVDMTRPVDVKLLPVLRAAYAYAGGPTGFVSQVTSAGIAAVSAADRPSAFRGSGSSTETSTTRVLRVVDGDVGPPPGVLGFADPGDPLAEETERASRVRVAVPGQRDQVWTYDTAGSRWRRTGGDGVEVSVANLIVQRTPYKTVVNKHVGSVESALAVGRGSCVALSRGQTASCTWSRPGRERQTNYSDSTAAPLGLQPGSTWVLLIPPGTTVTTS
ncbi:MAG: DUF3048 domain-containing protein [Streptosporangiales bacterium]|nr:DUF3048 domain-containing protein [Streptosporangiales bacterium]